MTFDSIPQAAWDRYHELEAEEARLKSTMGDLIGTSVPRVFYATENFIINPSNVGSGTLARMLETDDTCISAFQLMVLLISSKIGEYHHDNPEIKKFINGMLGQMKRPTWTESVEAILSGKGFGFSVSEMQFGIDEMMRKVVVRLLSYHPSTLAFEVDGSGLITENGILQYVLQYNQFSNPNNFWAKINYGFSVKNPFSTPVDRLMPQRIPFVYNYGLVRIPRNKVVHFTNMPSLSFGSPYGKSSLRAAHLAWQLKMFFMKQMGIAGKRNATNTIWGAAPQGTANVDIGEPGRPKLVTPREALIHMLKNREQDDALVTGSEADGYKLSSLSNQIDLAQYPEVISFLDVRIFRAFLTPSLVMTDGSAGSRSLGDKHFDVVNRVAESDAKKLGDTLINDCIERVIYENYGKQENYGHFMQRPQSLAERQMLQTMFAEGINSGILKTYVPGDMSYMRSAIAYPKDTDMTGGVQVPGGVPGKSPTDTDVDPINQDVTENPNAPAPTPTHDQIAADINDDPFATAPRIK